MFTGIIEEIGKVVTISRIDFGHISISCSKVLENTKIGDSIAVNGVCLTAKAFGNSSFTADVSGETFDKSSLGELRVGAKVNLERAARVGDAIGGHIVQGHIDDTGTIELIERKPDAIELRISAPETVIAYCVEKASIAIDGISLTISSIADGQFAIALIPHTFDSTNLASANIGDKVNLEIDIFAKYVFRYLQKMNAVDESKIDESFLSRHGYL